VSVSLRFECRVEKLVAQALADKQPVAPRVPVPTIRVRIPAMNDQASFAVSYFRPSEESFWFWSDDGRTVLWSDGTTLAFREELEIVLERLAPRGLPLCGALLLLLGACRDNYSSTGPGAARLRALAQLWEINELESQPLKWALTRVLERLDTIRELPPKLRQSPAAKAILAEVVFERIPMHFPAESAAQIVQGFQQGFPPASLQVVAGAKNPRWSYWYVLRSLWRALESGLNVEALTLRAETGLDQIVAPAEVEPPLTEKTRLLLAQLRTDDELFGLGRLAENLMAAVQLPRPLAQPEELPLGGVTDLTNRGPLDRLLLSELAQDDLTLSVRVALNEALYLRRETPPRQPATCRVLLLDSGLRQWGTPRIFATSLALAFQATGNNERETQVYRAHRDQIQSVRLHDREGLVAHLGVLEPDLHPGAALPAFWRALEVLGPQIEPILLTHVDSLADPEFRRLWAQSLPSGQALFVAAVSRFGAYQLWQFSSRGQKLLREATLDLERLLFTPRPMAASVTAASQPLLVGPDRWPWWLVHDGLRMLYLPTNSDPKRLSYSEAYGLMAVTSDARWMHFRDPAHGGREITHRLPSGHLNWLDWDEVGNGWLLIGHPHGTCQRLLNWRASGHQPPRQIELASEGIQPQQVWSRKDVLYLRRHEQIEAFSKTTGERVGRLLLPPRTLQTGQIFFRIHQGWNAVEYQNGQLRQVAVPVPAAQASLPHPVGIYEDAQREGPWGLLPTGERLNLTTGQVLELDGRYHPLAGKVRILHEVSSRGKELLVTIDFPREGGASVGRTCRIDLETGRLTILAGSKHWDVPSDLFKRHLCPSVNLWKNVHAVGVAGEELHLRDAQQQWRRITFREPGYFTLEQSDAVPSPVTSFVPINGPNGCRLKIKVARCAQGNSLYFDERGLLHFLARDSSIPEMTFVLALHHPTDNFHGNRALAGWCAHEGLFGPSYFLLRKSQPAASFLPYYRAFVSAWR